MGGDRESRVLLSAWCELPMTRQWLAALCSAAAATMLGCSAAVPPPPDVPPRADLCDVARRSLAYHDKSVTLTAAVLSDLIEHTFLTSDECPSETISLTLLPSAPGADELRRELVAGMPAAKIIATFTGTFEWTPDERPARVLNVSAVSDLHVVK